MFRAGQNSSPEPPADQAPQPRAVPETEALARAIKEGQVGGFVGVHSAVTGETSFRGMLRVDGRLSGRVRSEDGTLIVSAGGRVDAHVEVAVVKINGTVNGNVSASELIELGRSARVTGDIQTPALVVEQGAIFEGGCRMSGAPARPPRRTPNMTNVDAAPNNPSAQGLDQPPQAAYADAGAPAQLEVVGA